MNLVVAVIGMIILIIWRLIAKSYVFKGRLFKKSTYYILGVSLLLLMIVSLSVGDMTKKIPEKILTGIILSIPMYYLCKKVIEKKIKGNVIYYRQDTKFAKFKGGLLMVLIITAVNSFHLLRRLRQWHMEQLLQIVSVGGGIAWFISQIFILIYIAKLERRLGTSILEDIEDKST